MTCTLDQSAQTRACVTGKQAHVTVLTAMKVSLARDTVALWVVAAEESAGLKKCWQSAREESIPHHGIAVRQLAAFVTLALEALHANSRSVHQATTRLVGMVMKPAGTAQGEAAVTIPTVSANALLVISGVNALTNWPWCKSTTPCHAIRSLYIRGTDREHA